MAIQKLDDLFLAELEEAHRAEQLVVAASPGLSGLEAGPLTQWIGHAGQRAARLDRVFALLGERPAGASPTGGLLADVASLIDAQGADTDQREAVVAALDTLRHYLRARYMTLAAWATELDMHEAANLIAVTLREEEVPRAKSDISLGARLTAMFDRNG